MLPDEPKSEDAKKKVPRRHSERLGSYPALSVGGEPSGCDVDDLPCSLVFGMVSYQRLAIELMPDLSYPTLTVRTPFEGST